MERTRRSRCACTSGTSHCFAGWSGASRVRACMAPTATAAGTTTSGWLAARRWPRTCCRSSRSCSRRKSTRTPPRACAPCARATRISSRAMGVDAARSRVGELALRNGLAPRQRAQLERVLALLEADPHAPTTVRGAAEAVDVHIADSLAALEIDAVRAAAAVADLGAGAGFPGVALAVALPRASVNLIESQRRRCEFLHTLCSEAGVENARVVCARAEEWAEGASANDLVTARALAPQPVVLEYAAPLLRAGGVVVDWRGRRRRQEERQAQAAAEELGLERIEVRAVAPFSASQGRHLHLYMKVRPTPGRFPRRPGIARKRPLGQP